MDTQTKERLDDLLQDFEALRDRQVGYPCNQDFDYSALLPFLAYVPNNVGDPFHDSNFLSNTHEMEREVIGIFADMMHLPQEDAWGYVTSGGTEGNMYGLYMGREMFPDGVVYFSQDTHYSVVKIMRVLRARNIMIKSQDNGEIDYDDLYETVRINRDVPAIFMANIGTTMKGAIDDVSRFRQIADDLALTNYYIHADAALSGMILPFVEDPQPFGFDARLRQRRSQRPQDGRLAHTLRCSPHQTRLRRTRRALHRVRRRFGHHPHGFAQCHHPAHALVRLPSARLGRLQADSQEVHCGRRLRRNPLQRQRNPRMAQQELGYGRLPPSRHPTSYESGSSPPMRTSRTS